MKMLLTAVAMMIASPALAQTAPAGNHAGHAAHAAPAAPSGQAGHTGHAAAPAADPHAGHDMSGGTMDCCKKGADGAMACCAKMKAEGKSMSCCDKMKADGKGAPAAAGADPHAGHNMSPQ
jgi:hypothetical protein